MDDENQLALRAQAGEREAFALLVRRFQDRIFRFILRLIGNREDAMDLTQDTFLKAYRALPDWRPEARFSTWLFQIARNATLDLLRRRQLLSFDSIDADADGEVVELPHSGPGPDTQLEGRQSVELLERALHALPVDQREILLLREVEDMSYTELARVLGINEGTVKSRLARARAATLRHYRHHAGEHSHD